MGPIQSRGAACFLTAGLLGAAHLPAPVFGASAGEVPAAFRDAKGRDIRLKQRQDSLFRAAAVEREAEEREFRKALYKAIRLDEYEDDCVAYDPALPGCLLDVGRFNGIAETWRFPGRDSSVRALDRTTIRLARRHLLRDALEAGYVEASLRGHPARDSLVRAARAAVAGEIEERRREVGDSALRALYRRFHSALFRAREEPEIQVLATSDSSHAQLLLRTISGPRSDSASGALQSPVWQPVPVEDLPPAARSALKGAREGDIAGPIRTGFGYILLRIARMKRTPGLSFEAALPTLTALASLASDREDAVKAGIEQYYLDRREWMITPDTAILNFWLVPEYKLARGAGTGERRTGRLAVLRRDTSLVRPVKTEEFQLPPSLREKLGYYLPLQGREILGPLKSEYGHAYFQSLGTKKGGRPLSQEEASPAIRKALFGAAARDSIGEVRYYLDDQVASKEAEFFHRYLLERSPPAAQEGAATHPTTGNGRESDPHQEAVRRFERSREAWMRSLTLRFVDLEGQ